MKKLLKVILPPFVGLAVFFIAIRYSGVYFKLKIDEIGDGTIDGFMAYYRYFLPLLFLIALLTQLLIVVPIWDKVIVKSNLTKTIALISLAILCLLFALGLSYPICDKQLQLEKVCLFMTGVQIAYWIINFLTLLLLSRKAQPILDTTPITAE